MGSVKPAGQKLSPWHWNEDMRIFAASHHTASFLLTVTGESVTPAEARAALTGLGFDDEAGLAAAIRAGELDGHPEDITGCLRTLVRHRLAVAHPGYDSE